MKRFPTYVCALALFGVASATPVQSAIVPSGTYHYAVYSDGKVTASSTVVIVHETSSVTVKETIDLHGETVQTTRRLDPLTFATLFWSGYDDAHPDTITVASKSATYRHGGTTTTLAAQTDAPAAVFDFFVAEFSTLPAMIRMTVAARYNEYCVCIGGFEAKAISTAPASAPRPTVARPDDAAIALAAEGETATLWYDPKTFILRELDFPHERISYVRI
jgi:hypothetical protein